MIGIITSDKDDRDTQMIAVVDYETLDIIAGLVWYMLPSIKTLYVYYMITLKDYRGNGIQRKLFELMKEKSISLYPKEFKDGFDAIIAETRSELSNIPNDYFNTWTGVEATQKVCK